MTRIADILTRSRDSLVDHNKQRWSDDRLLRLVDEAQKDIARHSKLLKGQYEFSLEEGQSNYVLPDEVWLITRATFDNCEIPLTSHDQLDEQGRKEVINDRDYNNYERHNGYNYGDSYGRVCWETTTGPRTEYLVYDNRNMQDIRVYPIPDGTNDDSYTFQNAGYLDPIIYEADSPYGVLTGVPSVDELIEELGVTTDADSYLYLITDPTSCNGVTVIDDVEFNSVYGIVAQFEDLINEVAFHGDGVLGEVVGIDDYTMDSVYGFVGELFSPDIATENFDSPYGVVTYIAESTNVIKIWYIKTPETIEDMDDSLVIPTMFDTAIRYFVVGNAFMDDNDAAYRQKGQDTLSLYERELKLATTTSSMDGVRSPTNYRTSYRGPFE